MSNGWKVPQPEKPSLNDDINTRVVPPGKTSIFTPLEVNSSTGVVPTDIMHARRATPLVNICCPCHGESSCTGDLVLQPSVGEGTNAAAIALCTGGGILGIVLTFVNASCRAVSEI